MADPVFTEAGTTTAVCRSETIEFNGLSVVVDIESYTPERPVPFAQTPDSPGYDDEGDAEEVEYIAKNPKIECADTFVEWLNLDENDEFRAKVLEQLRCD